MQNIQEYDMKLCQTCNHDWTAGECVCEWSQQPEENTRTTNLSFHLDREFERNSSGQFVIPDSRHEDDARFFESLGINSGADQAQHTVAGAGATTSTPYRPGNLPTHTIPRGDYEDILKNEANHTENDIFLARYSKEVAKVRDLANRREKHALKSGKEKSVRGNKKCIYCDEVAGDNADCQFCRLVAEPLHRRPRLRFRTRPVGTDPIANKTEYERIRNNTATKQNEGYLDKGTAASELAIMEAHAESGNYAAIDGYHLDACVQTVNWHRLSMVSKYHKRTIKKRQESGLSTEKNEAALKSWEAGLGQGHIPGEASVHKSHINRKSDAIGPTLAHATFRAHRTLRAPPAPPAYPDIVPQVVAPLAPPTLAEPRFGVSATPYSRQPLAPSPYELPQPGGQWIQGQWVPREAQPHQGSSHQRSSYQGLPPQQQQLQQIQVTDRQGSHRIAQQQREQGSHQQGGSQSDNLQSSGQDHTAHGGGHGLQQFGGGYQPLEQQKPNFSKSSDPRRSRLRPSRTQDLKAVTEKGRKFGTKEDPDQKGGISKAKELMRGKVQQAKAHAHPNDTYKAGNRPQTERTPQAPPNLKLNTKDLHPTSTVTSPHSSSAVLSISSTTTSPSSSSATSAKQSRNLSEQLGKLKIVSSHKVEKSGATISQSNKSPAIGKDKITMAAAPSSAAPPRGSGNVPASNDSKKQKAVPSWKPTASSDTKTTSCRSNGVDSGKLAAKSPTSAPPRSNANNANVTKPVNTTKVAPAPVPRSTTSTTKDITNGKAPRRLGPFRSKPVYANAFEDDDQFRSRKK